MHDPAPQPETHRGRAEPVAERRLARRASSTPPRNWRRPPTTTISAPSNSSSITTPDKRQGERPGVRLHRGQSAASGRAYRHRGGTRPRSRAVAARSRGRRHAGFARSGAGLYPEAARLCDAAPRQHGGDGRERRDPADRRNAGDVRPAGRSRRSRRYVRLLGLPDQRRLRLAARQGDRAFARWRLDRRRAQGLAYPARVPHRRRRHQHSFPRGDSGASGFCREPSQHRFHRHPCRRPGRRGQHDGGDGADRIRQRRRRRGARSRYATAEASATGPAGSVAVPAPLQGTIVAIDVEEGISSAPASRSPCSNP